MHTMVYEIMDMPEGLSEDQQNTIVRRLYTNRGFTHVHNEDTGKYYVVIKHGLESAIGVEARLMNRFFDKPVIKDILKGLE
jgi:hypothetical protein